MKKVDATSVATITRRKNSVYLHCDESIFLSYLFIPTIIIGGMIGTFGTAILQLPVEGGYKGGSLKVGSEEKSGLLFENHQNSDARFYLSAFYGSFEYFVMPITQGWQLTLVFDLVWTNTKIVKPYDTSVSLAALREIENATNQWITLNKDNSSMEISKQPSAKNEFEDASSPKPSKIISNESDDGRHNSKKLNHYP